MFGYYLLGIRVCCQWYKYYVNLFLLENIRVFVVKTWCSNLAVLTYMCVYVCMYVCMLAKPKFQNNGLCVWEKLSGSESEKSQDTLQKKREFVSETVDMSYDRIQTQYLFFVQDKIKMREPSWKHMARDYSVQSVSRNYLNYRRPATFVSGKSESWILFFSNFFLPWGCCGGR